MTWIDALYFTLVTLTTVGYGDFHPSRDDPASQLFTCFFVLLGIVFISIALSFLIGRILDQEELLISRALDNDDSPDLPGRCGLTHRDWKIVVSVATFVLLLVLGVVVFAVAEELTFVQSLYLVCISVTTVGYGDEAPLEQGTKVFAIFWLSLATLSLAKTVSDIVDYSLAKKVLAIRHRVLHQKIGPKLFKRLDSDGDGRIAKYDFLVYQLVNGQWNVDQHDIDEIMSKFASLDRDNDESISLRDIAGPAWKNA